MPSFLFPDGSFYPQHYSFEFPNGSFYPRTTDHSFLHTNLSFFVTTDAGTPEPAVGAAVLMGGTVTDTGTLFSVLQGTTDASFEITVNGVAQQMGPRALHDCADLDAIAALFTRELEGVICVWNGTEFVFATTAPGPEDSISFASAPAGGTDVSSICRLTAATGASIVAGSKEGVSNAAKRSAQRAHSSGDAQVQSRAAAQRQQEGPHRQKSPSGHSHRAK